MLNKYSNVPLYCQLKNLILEKIEKGDYAPGSKIPSEDELCEQYKISRPTVRQAIGDLTGNGYLVKEKGKGTFVSASKAAIDLKRTNGFMDSVLEDEAKARRTYIATSKVTSADHKMLRDAFGLAETHAHEFARIAYLLQESGMAIALCVSYVPLALFPDIIEDIKFNKPAIEKMKGKYPFVPSASKMTIELEYASGEEAEHLQIQPGQALLKLTSVLQAKTGQTVEMIISSYRTDKCKLYFEELR
jgi:GntR family transcriptional regulator